MKKKAAFFWIIFLIINSSVTSVVLPESYSGELRLRLDKLPPFSHWSETEKNDFCDLLIAEKISPETLDFMARNLPGDTVFTAAASVEWLSTCREVDLNLKRGLSAGRVRLYLRKRINSLENNSQKTSKMLQYRGPEKDESLESRYRQGQLNQYKQSMREEASGGNHKQEGGHQNGTKPETQPNQHGNGGK